MPKKKSRHVAKNGIVRVRNEDQSETLVCTRIHQTYQQIKDQNTSRYTETSICDTLIFKLTVAELITVCILYAFYPDCENNSFRHMERLLSSWRSLCVLSTVLVGSTVCACHDSNAEDKLTEMIRTKYEKCCIKTEMFKPFYHLKTNKRHTS